MKKTWTRAISLLQTNSHQAGIRRHNVLPADFAFLEVEGHAGHAATEVDHLVEHDVGKAFDLGHAVADLANDAHVGFFDRGGDPGDLLFKFLEDAAHGVSCC